MFFMASMIDASAANTISLTDCMSRLPVPPDVSGGDAGHGYAIGDVGDHDCASGDDHAGADRLALDDTRAGANMGRISDRHITGQAGSRCNMDVLANPAVMIDGRTGVDDRVSANMCAR